MPKTPDQVCYFVPCASCNSNLKVIVKNPWIGEEWFVSEEERQVRLDGWTYTVEDYAICPGCAPKWSTGTKQAANA